MKRERPKAATPYLFYLFSPGGVNVLIWDMFSFDGSTTDHVLRPCLSPHENAKDYSPRIQNNCREVCNRVSSCVTKRCIFYFAYSFVDSSKFSRIPPNPCQSSSFISASLGYNMMVGLWSIGSLTRKTAWFVFLYRWFSSSFISRGITIRTWIMICKIACSK